MTITVEVEDCKREIHTFEDLVASAYKIAMEFGRALVSRTLEAWDEELRKTRDTRRYRSKEKQQISVKTRLGTIEYRRNVYTVGLPGLFRPRTVATIGAGLGRYRRANQRIQNAADGGQRDGMLQQSVYPKSNLAQGRILLSFLHRTQLLIPLI